MAFPASYILQQIENEYNVLKIKFEMIEPAYVKLNTFSPRLPLCNRFEVTQINKLLEKQNRHIKTTLSISVDEEENGLGQASKALADLIYKSLKISNP